MSCERSWKWAIGSFSHGITTSFHLDELSIQTEPRIQIIRRVLG